jgi:hypothetical protein
MILHCCLNFDSFVFSFSLSFTLTASRVPSNLAS